MSVISVFRSPAKKPTSMLQSDTLFSGEYQGDHGVHFDGNNFYTKEDQLFEEEKKLADKVVISIESIVFIRRRTANEIFIDTPEGEFFTNEEKLIDMLTTYLFIPISNDFKSSFKNDEFLTNFEYYINPYAVSAIFKINPSNNREITRIAYANMFLDVFADLDAVLQWASSIPSHRSEFEPLKLYSEKNPFLTNIDTSCKINTYFKIDCLLISQLTPDRHHSSYKIKTSGDPIILIE